MVLKIGQPCMLLPLDKDISKTAPLCDFLRYLQGEMGAGRKILKITMQKTVVSLLNSDISKPENLEIPWFIGAQMM